jgi:membrane protease YdiL (CAAX protease family)
VSTRVDPLADRLADEPTWRIVGLAAGIVLLTLVAIVLVVAVATVSAPVSPLSGRLHQAAVGIPAVLAFYEACRRIGPGVPARWFLTDRPDRRVLGWLGVGLAFPAAVVGAQLWLIDATLTNGPTSTEAAIGYVLASLAAGLLAGVLEELPLRGALLRVLETRWSARRAVLVTAATFAALHQGHADSTSSLALVLTSMFAAGLLLGAVVVRTRSVWNAVAVHAGWNTVFGGQVVSVAPAGMSLTPAVLQFRFGESASVLTGGPATLGAAPLTTVLLLLATIAVVRAPERWFGPAGGPG